MATVEVVYRDQSRLQCGGLYVTPGMHRLGTISMTAVMNSDDCVLEPTKRTEFDD
jgi:hypothetical protein